MGVSGNPQDRALQELYDQVPDMLDCKGKCWIACGPILPTDRERERLAKAGYPLPHLSEAVNKDGDHWCPALDANGKCRVYKIRPLVCRLWGTTVQLICPHGCTPKGEILSPEQAQELMTKARLSAGMSVSATQFHETEIPPDYEQEHSDLVRFHRYGDELPREVTEQDV